MNKLKNKLIRAYYKIIMFLTKDTRTDSTNIKLENNRAVYLNRSLYNYYKQLKKNKVENNSNIMDKNNIKFKNGDLVKDNISEFKGVITATCIYLTGATRYEITPVSDSIKNNIQSEWVDEDRLVLLIEGYYENIDNYR